MKVSKNAYMGQYSCKYIWPGLGIAWVSSLKLMPFSLHQEYIIPYREYRMPITTVQTLSGK